MPYIVLYEHAIKAISSKYMFIVYKYLILPNIVLEWIFSLQHNIDNEL